MKTIKIFTISILTIVSLNISGQIKVNSSGNVTIGGTSPTSAKLNLRSSNQSTLYSYSTMTFDWGQTIKSQVNRGNTVSYVVNLNGSDKFYVAGHGWIYSQGNYLGSDLKLKENIQSLESSLDKVLKLRGVKYKYKTSENSDPNISLVDSSYSNLESFDQRKINPEIEKTILSEKDRLRIGLIAQEVEQIVPDAVRTMHDGTKAIAYEDLIPLLIEAMKEQQQQIEELKKLNRVNGSKLKSATVISESIVDETLSSEAVLYQNTPNPFTEITEIKYFLSDKVKSATLYIYNMQGNQIKSIPLYNRGLANETIHGSELQAGMYIYALIADGKEIDSKRMILTD